MSYKFLGATIVAPVHISSDQTNYSVIGLNKQKDHSQLAGQRFLWTFGIESGGMPGIMAQLLANFGKTVNFNVLQPHTGLGSEIATISQPAAVGDSQITIPGDVVVPSGRFLKFNNHGKVYMVVSNSGPVHTLYPSLIREVPADNQIRFGNNIFINAFVEDDSELQVSYDDGILSSIKQITVGEAL